VEVRVGAGVGFLPGKGIEKYSGHFAQPLDKMQELEHLDGLESDKEAAGRYES
jgi:predicted ribonuclease YlaK